MKTLLSIALVAIAVACGESSSTVIPTVNQPPVVTDTPEEPKPDIIISEVLKPVTPEPEPSAPIPETPKPITPEPDLGPDGVTESVAVASFKEKIRGRWKTACFKLSPSGSQNQAVSFSEVQRNKINFQRTVFKDDKCSAEAAAGPTVISWYLVESIKEDAEKSYFRFEAAGTSGATGRKTFTVKVSDNGVTLKEKGQETRYLVGPY